jgi:hypothetical protein
MEIKLDEGRVYGSRYYTAKPLLEFESIWMANMSPWNDMVEWCVDTFGPTPKDGVWTPSSRWYVNNATFWFRNQEDLMIFVLRWS